VAAVAHRQFKERPLADYVGKLQKNGVFTDVKSIFSEASLVAQGVTVWRL
jgi:UDP-N-acetyl-D-galactosamine dehydrogenase